VTSSYVTTFREALLAGRSPPAPRTPAELELIAQEYPRHLPRFLPAEEIRQRCNLDHLANPPRPFGHAFRERLLATADADQQFASLLSYVLRRAG